MVVYDGRTGRTGRPVLSRDEVVEKGFRAKNEAMESERHPGPWLYTPKVKSGTRRTTNPQYEAYNLLHLMALVVMDYAREGELLSMHGIRRVLKSGFRSNREDV